MTASLSYSLIIAKSIELENSLLLICQILELFVNTLAADEKYPLLKRDNLTIPIEMQLSQKHKTFSRFFTAFLKSRWTFEHFDKKGDADGFCNFEIKHSENVVREMSKKPRLRKPFDKEHCKRAQAMLKSASQHLSDIHWSLPKQLIRKRLSFWHVKSWDCLLTCWLAMKNMLLLIETI